VGKDALNDLADTIMAELNISFDSWWQLFDMGDNNKSIYFSCLLLSPFI
jgi:hypothetical protein